MATISVSLPTDGTTADVADYNTPINSIVDEINGGLDNSNISASAAIATSKLASDAGITSAKLAQSFFKGRYQSDNNNTIASSDQSGLTVQFGWGQIVGDGTNTIETTVTFPTAFSTVLFFQPGLIGATATDSTAATSITDLEVELGGGAGWSVSSSDLTTTSVNVTMARNTGTFETTRYLGFSWIAIGVV